MSEQSLQNDQEHHKPRPLCTPPLQTAPGDVEFFSTFENCPSNTHPHMLSHCITLIHLYCCCQGMKLQSHCLSFYFKKKKMNVHNAEWSGVTSSFRPCDSSLDSLRRITQILWPWQYRNKSELFSQFPWQSPNVVWKMSQHTLMSIQIFADIKKKRHPW